MSRSVFGHVRFSQPMGGTGHRIAKFHVARDETTYFKKVVFPACASLESKYALCVLAICGSVNSVVWLSCIDSGGVWPGACLCGVPLAVEL